MLAKVTCLMSVKSERQLRRIFVQTFCTWYPPGGIVVVSPGVASTHLIQTYASTIWT